MSVKWAMMFIFIAKIFAIGVLIYVVVDIIADLFRRRKKEEKPAPAVVPVVAPVEAPPVVVPVVAPVAAPVVAPVIIPVVLPEIVDHIDAEEADELMEDEVAVAAAQHEYGAGEGARSYINIGVIDKHYNSGDTVTLADLKRRKLMPTKIKRIKILADGVLTKDLTVKAESFSIQAMKMITLTGGTVVVLEPEPKSDEEKAKGKKGKKKR